VRTSAGDYPDDQLEGTLDEIDGKDTNLAFAHLSGDHCLLRAGEDGWCFPIKHADEAAPPPRFTRCPATIVKELSTERECSPFWKYSLEHVDNNDWAHAAWRGLSTAMRKLLLSDRPPTFEDLSRLKYKSGKVGVYIMMLEPIAGGQHPLVYIGSSSARRHGGEVGIDKRRRQHISRITRPAAEGG
jgi:hypothetical protein